MANIPFATKEHVIYENLVKGMLVAISSEENTKIRDFKKKNKGKKKSPSTKVKGYSFVLDQEFNSLKIDFTAELTFEIKDLKLFPLK